jgi:hypothetical protein
MLNPNDDIVPFAGILATDKNAPYVIDPMAARCDGCGADILLSRNMLMQCADAVEEDGKRPVFVCMSCAAPWLDEIARHGGELIGPIEAISDAMTEVNARRQKQTLAN